jgi:hypothetical protein
MKILHGPREKPPEMKECEAKAPDIFHMDLLYDEIDDITLSQVCQAMENEPP